MSFIEGEITVEFGGTVGPAGPAGNAVPIAAGTVLANPTGSLANPVGVDAAGMRTLIGAAGTGVANTFTAPQTIAKVLIQEDASTATPAYNDYWRTWVSSFDINAPHSTNLNTVLRWGFNVGSGGERINSSDGGLHDAIEANFYLPNGTAVLERHWEAQTIQGKITRYVSALIPKNNADRGQSQVGFTADSILISDWDSQQKAKLDFSNSSLSQWSYNVPIATLYPRNNGALYAQKNQADNSFVQGPLLNSNDDWQFSNNIIVANTTAVYAASSQFAVVRWGVATNNEIISESYFESANSGSKVIPHKSHGIGHGGVENLIENISDQVTGYSSLRVKSAAGGGDAKHVLESASQTIAFGIDVSDGNAFVLSANQNLGTSNLVRIDPANGDTRLNRHLNLGGRLGIGNTSNPTNFVESVSDGVARIVAADGATASELRVARIQDATDSFKVSVGGRLNLGSTQGDTGFMSFQNTINHASAYNRAALMQDANCLTIINAGSGQYVSIRVANGEVMRISASGDIRFMSVPNSNPGVAGQIWNDSGTLKIS